MKHLFLTATWVAFWSIGSGMSAKEILDRTKAFYETGGFNYFEVRSKFKSSIASDTSQSVVNFYQHEARGSDEGYLLVSNGAWHSVIGANAYFIYDTVKRTFKELPPRQARELGYYKTFEQMPFGDADRFYKRFGGAVTEETGTAWLLKDGGETLVIDKGDFSVKALQRIKETRYGTEYFSIEVIAFSKKNGGVELAALIAGIRILYSETGGTVRKKISGKEVGIAFPEFAVRSVSEVDYNRSKLKGKYVILDLFYQSCLPCIKSFGEWKEFSRMFDTSKVIVLGIDPVPGDTLNMKAFMDRYGLNYDVIAGKGGDVIWKHIGNTGFPYTVVLDPEGKVFYVIEYYKPKEIGRLAKVLRARLALK